MEIVGAGFICCCGLIILLVIIDSLKRLLTSKNDSQERDVEEHQRLNPQYDARSTDDNRAFLIQRARYYAKEGDINALKELIALLWTANNREGYLVDVYCAEKCTDEQKKLIEAQEHLISKETLDIESTMILINRGSIEALKHLILLLKLGKLDIENNERWRSILPDIYTSGSSTPEEKKLIWDNKDILVYISVTEYEADDHDGGTYTKRSYKKFSVYDYIKLREGATGKTKRAVR